MHPPDEDQWDAWSPDQLAAKLCGATVPWYVVGGWALDLWRGKARRAHGDLEFATLPEHACALAAQLTELTFFEAKAGDLRAADLSGPVVETAWQFWGADMAAKRWRVDMMLERGTASHWVYKRDPRITQRRELAIRTGPGGIGFLSPAIVLLFKAKQTRPKDQEDFDAALPALSDADRAALRDWLGLCHPDHPWLRHLS